MLSIRSLFIKVKNNGEHIIFFNSIFFENRMCQSFKNRQIKIPQILSAFRYILGPSTQTGSGVYRGSYIT